MENLSYFDWKEHYKRSEDFTRCIRGIYFNETLKKFFDETSYSFYLMYCGGYIPVKLSHGLMFSTSKNKTLLFRAVQESLECRYGKSSIDYILGASDDFGHYVLFFVKRSAREAYEQTKKGVYKNEK